MIEIAGVTTSTELLQRLADLDEPLILNFSRGKDSIATWLAMLDAGVKKEHIIPIMKYTVPDMEFVNKDLERFEAHFDTRIIQVPHYQLYRMLKYLIFQTPERCAGIQAAQIATMTGEDTDRLIRSQYATPETWIVDGVRAADSPTRRMSFMRWGPSKERTRRMSPIWDWTQKEVYARIEKAGIALSPDYEWFGRSLDGIGCDYTIPLRKHSPADYQRILDLFPMADIEIFRHEVVMPALRKRKETR